METFTLSNGQQVPMIGFGTYNPGGKDSCRMVLDAIETGYRYFDTASLYETERALGEAVKQSGIDRSEFVIATKLWIDEMGYKETYEAFERSLNRLQTDYLDFYLIHWPRREENDTDWKERCLTTWKAMEELQEKGRIKALGLSNFLPHHLEIIWQEGRIKPMVNQMELHPGYMQEAALAACSVNEILAQAWSPLGRAKLLEHPFMNLLADKYAKSPAQISLRYLLQRGIQPIVKASGKERMKQNLDVFDFIIEAEDMSLLSCLPQTAWSGEHPDYGIPKVKSNFLQ